MRILVGTQGKAGLKDSVSPVFGRAPTFTIVKTDNGSVKDVEPYTNKWAGGSRGVGIQAAQFAANKGVDVIIAGNIGPNASGVLNQAGIEIVTGFAGSTVNNAVGKYLKGEMPAQPSQQRAAPQQPPIQQAPQRTPSQPMGSQMPMQPPTPMQTQKKPTKIDIEFQKKMLTLQKEMIKTQIEYLEKKIQELKNT